MTYTKMRMFRLDVEKRPITDTIWENRVYIAIGEVVLSADCVTASEVHQAADDLIAELEHIKREASRMQWTNDPRFA